ncbi:MAG: MdtA/MuxA family multidrug efflux RND transporter periplasmic adaptor subunit [Ewingella americana]|jgi:multidrug efflux system membrane fusion protein|uniref:MdtA/MuxA family multidrug efflux RND transporter periplasmic adaptor subunit n=1 Tax=Ewingella americana TaxID=41202 RepID=UPI00242F5BAC|nr:MdtA/MuxA family multidrug efflux RND transporter periplasmic adaptor subunit [Ewingella americana]MCI1679352.1 MdtA/MuxA family multidrug efflux RND transporter periplasmic adaptor subunit [Ewingella americana]MCI1854679.1 MdtA/MuxA family multidrug efflux RND transporter periplasmic adaptor subunit [Ewingella americana]MCI1862038.1 MdtA/MuxA family multidrug efflux RND transporter periplasmic adaptor subunit [Ewingella americana]MCI2142581.1 MdtA/MuxA family multidrug efflux RND transporte
MLPNTSSRPKNRNRLWLVIAVIIAAILVWYFAFHHSSSGAPDKQAGPGRGGMRGGMHGVAMAGAQTPVQAGKAEQADVPVYLRALGTVVANATVTVTSRVDGQLMKVYFTEGQKVEQGQLLAQIDPRSYQATLEQYQGDLAQNQALAKSAELTLARYKKLYAQDSLARQDLESQMATAGQYAGAVKADQAQIAAAKLNLEFAKITAPVSGHVGLRLVDPGNMVTSGSTTGIVTITQTQPIAVTFSVPQSNLQTLLKALRGGQQLPTTAFDQDGSEVLGQGKLQFISNEIDTSTGSIKLKALFDNQDEKLYPNQFVNARLQVGTLEKATVIPAAALQLSGNGDFVYVVKADNSVERREVKAGPAFGDDKVAILSGIQLGEQVVTTGIDHLNNGSKVQVVTASTEDDAAASKAGSSKQRAEQGGVDKATTGKDSGSK